MVRRRVVGVNDPAILGLLDEKRVTGTSRSREGHCIPAAVRSNSMRRRSSSYWRWFFLALAWCDR